MAKDNLNRMTLYIGIDPGAKGALALIDDKGNELRIDDWPGTEQDLVSIMEEIDLLYPCERYRIFAALEKVGSMPKQGISSAFKFGTNYGIWRGILASFEIPFILVTPQRWMKGLISPKDLKQIGKKKASYKAAKRLFPYAALKGPKGGILDGRCDALLIADWRRRN